MKITKDWLEEKQACSESVAWFNAQKETDAGKIIEKLAESDHWEWANWTIVRVMTRPQYLAYVIYAAEQVIDIYEKKYPDDRRPRNAIDAAKAVLKSDTAVTRAAAWAAGAAAWAAGAAAWAAGAAMRTKILKYGVVLLAEKETK